MALKSVRNHMVDAGLARTSINQHVGRIRRMFKWLGSEQLIPASLADALRLVDGLRVGRTSAREPEPVEPVADSTVDAALPELPKVGADTVRLQRLTGARPAEICQLCLCALDRSGHVWLFNVEGHKTAHHGRSRTICIGPKGQEILLRYLARDSGAYGFQPCDSEKKATIGGKLCSCDTVVVR